MCRVKEHPVLDLILIIIGMTACWRNGDDLLSGIEYVSMYDQS